MTTEYERKEQPTETLRLLKTLVELQASHNNVLNKLTRQIDTVICALEHISKQTCATLNEENTQTDLQAVIKTVSEALLELYKTVHPDAALAYEKLEKVRKELLECCPPEEPKPLCTYEPCEPQEPESGSRESVAGTADPNRVIGAPFPPAEHCDTEEPNEDEGREVPRGPFRGFVTPGRELRLMDFKSGPGGDDPDPVVFGEYTAYGTTATPMSTVAADISGAESGNVVLATGNWYAVYSTDGGNTFTSIDPTTVFPNTADGGFCCDQIVQYAPTIDRFIWLMQFNPGADGNSRLRIAAASPQDIINSRCTSWTYWDLTSAQFGIAAAKDTTGPLDYPDMSIGDNFLYVSVDARGSGRGLLVVRVPLNEIQAGGTINFRFTTPSDSTSAYGGHLSQNTGDEVFWAGAGKPKDNGTLQVFSWAENSTSYFWRDVGLNYNWPNGTISSIAQDGTTDWLNKLDNFPKFGVTGATRHGNEVWFAWTASSGDGGHGGFSFPNPHVQVVKIDVKNSYKLLDHFPIWNNDHAFAYPCLATNDRGEVGVSLGWGGAKKFYANSAVGILGDFVVWYPELSDTATTRWGDYVTVRQASPQTGMFAGFGYAILKDSTKTAGYRFDPFYILFGRNSVVNPGPIIK